MGSSPSKAGYLWQWQSNQEPWNVRQRPFWNNYPGKINEEIEEAFKQGNEIYNIGQYTITFKELNQVHNEDNYRQRPVRRVAAETVDEYNTGNRVTDRTPPPFKSIS